MSLSDLISLNIWHQNQAIFNTCPCPHIYEPEYARFAAGTSTWHVHCVTSYKVSLRHTNSTHMVFVWLGSCDFIWTALAIILVINLGFISCLILIYFRYIYYTISVHPRCTLCGLFSYFVLLAWMFCHVKERIQELFQASM